MRDEPGAGRDRYVDLVRAVAICAVVVGHWSNAVVTSVDGRFDLGYLLLQFPRTQYLTLTLQVMPVVFLVAGYANAASWTRQPGRSYRAWLLDRLRAVVRPTVTLLVAWLAGGVGLLLAGIDLPDVVSMARHALGPLWFLGIYLPLVAAAPFTLRLHRRYGWRVFAGLTLLAVVGEVSRLLAAAPALAWANCAWVWLAVHQLGYHWQDGSLRAPRRSTALIGGGIAVLVLLIGAGVVPVNMVDRRNTTPPSLALLALGCAHTGVVVRLRPHGQRWLARSRLTPLLPTLNRLAMLIYLWHVTAVMLLAAWLVIPGLWPQATVATPTWWAWRLPWLVLVVLVAAMLVGAAAAVERRSGRRRQDCPAAPPSRTRSPRRITGEGDRRPATRG